MKEPEFNKPPLVIVLPQDLHILFELLVERGFKTIGPTIRDGAISYQYLNSSPELPAGYMDQQDAGQYKLRHTDGKLLFDYHAAANNWKRHIYPPQQKLWEARKIKNKFKIENNPGETPGLAFLGVLPCDLNAILILDKILTAGPYADTAYRNIRENSFIIASNCTRAGNNCFCASMDTGPRARSGFDLAFTEIMMEGNHIFIFESGSRAGSELLKEVPHRKAEKKEFDFADTEIKNAASQMRKNLDTKDIIALMDKCFDHPHWKDIASRCLTCGNCTMVCPTCFCSSIEDTTDLTGDTAQRWRRWDSCFTRDHSYIAGGSVRHTAKARYRQWFTHKLVNWYDQFGTPGCVGCGRCITWCPVGIDITEEARIFGESGLMLHSSISKKDR